MGLRHCVTCPYQRDRLFYVLRSGAKHKSVMLLDVFSYISDGVSVI